MSGERRRQIKQILSSWWGNQPLQPLEHLAARIDAAIEMTTVQRHEDTAEYWRANAAEETRKKQHVSKLLERTLRERDEARAALAELEEEVRRMCVFGNNGDLILRRWQPRLVPRVAALLRAKEVPTP